jgi:hypothetical protein
MYGFHKIRENAQESYFHHPHFLRSRPQELSLIKRKPEKKKKMVEGEVRQRQQTIKNQRKIVEMEGGVSIHLLR